jgi:hypothetical protein
MGGYEEVCVAMKRYGWLRTGMVVKKREERDGWLSRDSRDMGD